MKKKPMPLFRLIQYTKPKYPPILIFDEATSSVDNETEAAIQRSLEKITIDLYYYI